MTRLRHRYSDIRKIKRQFPQATDIRGPMKCDSCKAQNALFTYVNANEPIQVRPARDGGTDEACGYFCVVCRWGNAGSREYTGGDDDDTYTKIACPECRSAICNLGDDGKGNAQLQCPKCEYKALIAIDIVPVDDDDSLSE